MSYFIPKRLKNHTLWRRTYLYSLCKGVPTPTPRGAQTSPYFRPKWSKSMSYFIPKRLKNHTLWRRTYLYSLYKGVPTPTPRGHKPHPISDQNGQNLCPISDHKGSKTIPFGVAHTYIAYIREYPPPPPGGTNLTLFQTKMVKIYVLFHTKKAQKPYPLASHIPI